MTTHTSKSYYYVYEARMNKYGTGILMQKMYLVPFDTPDEAESKAMELLDEDAEKGKKRVYSIFKEDTTYEVDDAGFIQSYSVTKTLVSLVQIEAR